MFRLTERLDSGHDEKSFPFAFPQTAVLPRSGPWSNITIVRSKNDWTFIGKVWAVPSTERRVALAGRLLTQSYAKDNPQLQIECCGGFISSPPLGRVRGRFRVITFELPGSAVAPRWLDTVDLSHGLAPYPLTFINGHPEEKGSSFCGSRGGAISWKAVLRRRMDCCYFLLESADPVICLDFDFNEGSAAPDKSEALSAFIWLTYVAEFCEG